MSGRATASVPWSIIKRRSHSARIPPGPGITAPCSYHARGDLDQALADLNRALALAARQGFDFLEARLNLGLVRAGLGDAAGARAAYESVIAAAAGEPYLARIGRLNRAQLDIEAGAVDRAWAEYDALLAEDPRDAPARDARLGRALLALRLGQPAAAEADLTIVLQADPEECRGDLRVARPGPARACPPARRRGRRRQRLSSPAQPEPRTALESERFWPWVASMTCSGSRLPTT